jgi:uncharacterized protein
MVLLCLSSCAGRMERAVAPYKDRASGSIREAVRKADITRIRTLLDKNPNLVRARDSSGYTPLHWASIDGNREVVELLIDRGAEVNGRTPYGLTPLHLASRAGKLDTVKLLISRGAEVNALTKDGVSPLREAISSGHEEVSAILRSCGARD